MAYLTSHKLQNNRDPLVLVSQSEEAGMAVKMSDFSKGPQKGQLSRL